MKKVSALVIMIVMALSLSACNNNEAEPDKNPSDGSNSQQQNTLGSEKNQDNYEDNKSTKEQDTAPTDDEDQTPDESLYAYYDLLNEEYEKYGIAFSVSPYNNVYYSSKENTVVIYKYSKSTIASSFYNIIKYNVETKSTEIIEDCVYDNAMVYNDVMYSTNSDNYWEGNLFADRYDFTQRENAHCYNFNSKNELWDNINQFNKPNVISQSDGTLFLQCYMDGLNSDDEHFMISADGEKLTVLPLIEVEAAHGIKEMKGYDMLACYNNNLFVISSSGDFYCLDTNTLSWEKLDFDLTANKASNYKSVGRYLLFGSAVYDMETKEALVQNLNTDSFASTYYGGKYNLRLNGNTWYFEKYPSDGSDVNPEDTLVYDFNKESLTSYTPINDKYYVVKDKYGFFLRSYEKGVEEEETIYLTKS